MGNPRRYSRMRDFARSVYDLTQSVQARYLGSCINESSRWLRIIALSVPAARAVSDSTAQYVPAKNYPGWVGEIAVHLDTASTVSRSFCRFVQASPAPPDGKAVPRNVLFDFADIIGEDATTAPADWHSAVSRDLAAAVPCVGFHSDGSFLPKVGSQHLSGNPKYEITGAIRKRGRYTVELPGLDEKLVRRSVTRNGKPQTLSGIVSCEQAFRVVPEDPILIYAQRYFYTPAMSVAEIANDQVGVPLEHVLGFK